MEIKYSKKQFEGYTHRFMVLMQVDNDWRNDSTITIYSNDGNKDKLEKFINQNKSDKVVGFEIVHISSKEQDELDSKFIDEVLNSI